ncbi:serine/threonine protein kinase [Actinomadura madurae]|uniref:non-specific serine/threonine protein kinase n=1 Tax=Actinomadura madurae TaxID=1993 RepID=A0A1I5N8F4_9ACTN|nr:serine/threonine-protein kinase [Actinomadura madurae]SFP18118.1 serine/threonine protein kinase [Actinomadura madurae]
MNGWRVDGFDEVRELGAGAQGRVVLAVPHGAGNARVAIKYLAPALLADERSLAVFRREAETLARVGDPNVARLYQYVENPQGAAIVMEAVAGASLREVLDQQDGQGLAPEAALTVLKGSLLGLAAAHAVGVVHRDYKPANVVVQPDGASKLIDFGIAVLTGQGSRAGTPAYMAPEQWQGGPASPATDLYAASCVFYECLTGAKPYRGGTIAQLMTQHLNAPVPFQDAPEPLRPLLARGLAKDPGRRLWNAGEFVAELERHAVAAYGPDWERRGVRALAAAVAALASAVPLAMLGSFAAEGTMPATAAPGSVPLQQSAASHAADAVARPGRGFFKRAGGTKTVIAAAAAIGAAAAIAGGFVIADRRSGTSTEVSPSTRAGGGGSPTATATAGGQATGRLRVGFRNPGPLGAGANPTAAYDLTVEPANVAPGATLKITVTVTHAAPGWLIFFVGEDRNTDTRMSFWPTPPAAPGKLPEGDGTVIVSRMELTGDQSDPQPGGQTITRVTLVHTATVPAGTVRPGRYLVSPFVPLAVTNIQSEGGKRHSAASVGAYVEGSLPAVTVLGGSGPAPVTSTPAPPPTTRGPAPCPTITRADGSRIVRCN